MYGRTLTSPSLISSWFPSCASFSLPLSDISSWLLMLITSLRMLFSCTTARRLSALLRSDVLGLLESDWAPYKRIQPYWDIFMQLKNDDATTSAWPRSCSTAKWLDSRGPDLNLCSSTARRPLSNSLPWLLVVEWSFSAWLSSWSRAAWSLREKLKSPAASCSSSKLKHKSRAKEKSLKWINKIICISCSC